MSYVISTHNLSKSYNGVQALRSLNLEVPQNAIVGFLGPNGAGKSTTIKLLLGLIRPTGGGGTVFGLDILRDSVSIRQRVGYLAQQPRFYDYMTARDILRFTSRLFFHEDTRAVDRRVDEALELVNLTQKADRRVKGFSGGELQRLGIAQAQINKPELLILDEPAASLDPMGRHDVLQIMENLRHQTTIFYSTHILDDVQHISDYVVILDHGNLIKQGTTTSLLQSSTEPSYTLTLEGKTSAVRARLTEQPWFSALDEKEVNGLHLWHVRANNEACAKQELLRLILNDSGVNVLAFGREEVELETVFMRLIDGKKYS
ncbi:MAG: ABC transporter ATP-binding protein [Anaerolineae bacterium]|nr:ABC transporter ATP-binding protein [Anaerolineae bacterium]